MVPDFLNRWFGIGAREIARSFKDKSEELVWRVRYEIYRAEKRIIMQLVGISVILIGIIFLLLAVLFFLIEYLGLNIALSFLIVGAILVVIGLIMKGSGRSESKYDYMEYNGKRRE